MCQSDCRGGVVTAVLLRENRTYVPFIGQRSLLGSLDPASDESFGGLTRPDLDADTWVDHAPGWLTGADLLFDTLVTELPFRLYRDGNDSVAWHGDRHRHVVTNPVIAIVSVGAPRPLKLRPRGGGGGGGRGGGRGNSLSWSLGHGDLFVMGGACQHEWEHTVPKVRTVTGARLSITFRSV